jgi:hypothetical protein
MRLRIRLVSAATTVAVSLSDTLIKAVKRECRSTSVTMWLFFEPLTGPLPNDPVRPGLHRSFSDDRYRTLTTSRFGHKPGVHDRRK